MRLTKIRRSFALILNSENASPFCEIATVALVFFASLSESIQTLGRAFVVTSSQWLDTLIDLEILFRVRKP